jgi:hypothetical protein
LNLKLHHQLMKSKKDVIIKDIVQEEQFSSTINEKQEKQAVELPETIIEDDDEHIEPGSPVEDIIVEDNV